MVDPATIVNRFVTTIGSLHDQAAAPGKGAEIDAKVAETEKALRDAGLLTGPPAAGRYRQWLENAVRRACRSTRSRR